MYVDENRTETRRRDLASTNPEAVWLEIQERSNRRAVFRVLYRPPSSDSSFMTRLSGTLQMLGLELK